MDELRSNNSAFENSIKPESEDEKTILTLTSEYESKIANVYLSLKFYFILVKLHP